MDAQTNFNKRTAPIIEVSTLVSRQRIQDKERPVSIWLRCVNSRSRLIIWMTDAEALQLAAELYANSDRLPTDKPIDTPHK